MKNEANIEIISKIRKTIIAYLIIFFGIVITFKKIYNNANDINIVINLAVIKFMLIPKLEIHLIALALNPEIHSPDLPKTDFAGS